MQSYPDKIAASINRYRFREAGQELMNLARLGNKYLADEEPWKLIKTDEERVKTIMYVALQIATGLAVLSEPFLPFTSRKLKSILNISQLGRETILSWNDVKDRKELIATAHQIGKSELLFTKVEDNDIQKQLDKLEATKKINEAENKEVEPPVSYTHLTLPTIYSV